MKITITMALSALFVAASSGITAEEGLMKAIAQIDHQPKPLIIVGTMRRTPQIKHIRELHGDIADPRYSRGSLPKTGRNLAKFKAKLRKQKQARLVGFAQNKATAAY